MAGEAAFACAPYQNVSTVEVNGQMVGSLPITYCDARLQIRRVVIDVPIGALRFAQRTPGGSPIEGVNTINVYSGARNLPVECGDHDGNSIGEMYLDFEASAPVALVHGIDSGPEWFTGFGFENGFRDVRMGYKPHGEISRPLRCASSMAPIGYVIGRLSRAALTASRTLLTRRMRGFRPRTGSTAVASSIRWTAAGSCMTEGSGSVCL
jgi:hypothetical protein